MKHKKSKRGIALENAIIFMMLTFTLCTLLASFVLLGYNYTRLSHAKLLDRIALSQAIDAAPYPKEEGKPYYSEKEENTIKVFQENGTCFLVVTLDGAGEIISREKPTE